MSDHHDDPDVAGGEVGSVEAGPTPPADTWHADPTRRAETRHAGRSGQGGSGGRGSDEPGGYDEYDAPRREAPREDTVTTEALNDDPVTDPDVTDPDLADLDDPDPEAGEGTSASDVHPDTKRAAEHLDDLRRVSAEYVNYKKRVDRDRDLAREQGVTVVIEALLPVLDDIHLARQHGDLDGGPFAAIADKLEAVLARFGVTALGAEGEPFDPTVHEALMHVEAELPESATTTTVVHVLQPGYKVGERVVRPARVSVADPQ